MSLNKVQGWYADTASGDGGLKLWQPVLQSELCGVTELPVMFDSRAECENFIRTALVGAGWLDGPRSFACPVCEAAPWTWCRGTLGESRLFYHSERNAYTHGGWPDVE